MGKHGKTYFFFLPEAISAFENSNNVNKTVPCDLNNSKYQLAYKIKINPNIDFTSGIFSNNQTTHHSLKKYFNTPISIILQESYFSFSLRI